MSTDKDNPTLSAAPASSWTVSPDQWGAVDSAKQWLREGLPDLAMRQLEKIQGPYRDQPGLTLSPQGARALDQIAVSASWLDGKIYKLNFDARIMELVCELLNCERPHGMTRAKGQYVEKSPEATGNAKMKVNPCSESVVRSDDVRSHPVRLRHAPRSVDSP